MMSTEREIKILNIDKNIIKQKICNWGCVWMHDFLITDTYRDGPGSHYSLHKKKVKLRVYSHHDGCELIVKQKLSNKKKKIGTNRSKVCHEESVVLASYQSAERFLIGQGLSCIRTKQKIRSQAQLGSVFFMIDEYVGIPPLLEIEAQNDQIIDEWIVILGLEHHERTTVGWRGLCKKYGINEDKTDNK